MTSIYSSFSTVQSPSLTSKQMLEVIKVLWPSLDKTDINIAEYSVFFDYIEREIRLLHHRTSITTGTLELATRILPSLQAHGANTRDDIMQIIQKEFLNADYTHLLQCAELAIRIWLTLNIRSQANPTVSLQTHLRAIDWKGNVTLQELINGLFPENSTPISSKQIMIDPGFSAAHLVKVCSVKLNWSDNLAEHLRFDKKNRVLTVYKHKICLINHYESKENTIIPKEILLEALDTLNLLFPFPEESTEELLVKEKQPFWSLGTCKRARELDLSKYSYWGDQLRELCLVFNEPPHKWWQLLVDRRNKKEYVTLMIAILAFILALFSLILGGISAVYAVKQYNLGVAQACSTWQGQPMLAYYCM